MSLKKNAMWYNYLKIAIRNVIRNKVFSFINLFGLSVGIASVILILLWVEDELSFDCFHENGNSIYRVLTKFNNDADRIWTTSPFPLGSYLKENYPEVISYTRYWTWNPLVEYEDKVYYENDFKLVDQSFLEMFSFPLIKGNRDDALKSKSSVLITEKIARKYFGESDPVGKVITVNKSELLTVTGVMKDIPENTSINFSMLSNMEHIPSSRLQSWAFDTQTFIQLSDVVASKDFQSKIDSLYKSVMDPNTTGIPYLQNLRHIHLNEYGKPLRIIFVRIFSIVAAIILLLACINYMNLSTAKSISRAKEIGLRKISGADKEKIVFQFLGESLLLTLISMIIALVFVEIARPTFNDFVQKNIQIHYTEPIFIGGLVCILFLTGLVSGVYPAFVLSSYKPINILRGVFTSNKLRKSFINVLVAFQFTIAILLTIVSIVVYKQIQFLNNKDLGLTKENILVVQFIPELEKRYKVFKDELLKNTSIVNVSAVYNLPTDHSSYVQLNWEGNPDNEEIGIFYNMVDYDFIETMGMEILAGRTFSEDFTEDDSISYIINESALRSMNVTNPIGLNVEFEHPDFPDRFRRGKIVGVVKDFHLRPLREKIVPLAMRMYRPWYNHILIKYDTNNIQELIYYIQGVVKKFVPNYPFIYSFFDQEVKNLYSMEFRIGRIVLFFTILSIIISCIGFLGLTINELEKQTKPIGIRKVHGASISYLVVKFCIAFLTRVILAFVIASIIGIIVIQKILQNYAYKTEINIWIFFGAFAIALIITLSTIIFKIYSTSVKNPVDSLRYE